MTSSGYIHEKAVVRLGDLEDHGIGTTTSNLAVAASKSPTSSIRHHLAARKKTVAGTQI